MNRWSPLERWGHPPALPVDEAGFTLVELLVSMAVVSLILVIGVQMVNSVSTLATRTRARVETFQESRAAFESMTRKLSEAMLNTYWDYDLKTSGTTIDTANSSYVRQSELHFICGQSKNGDAKSALLRTIPTIQTTTHAVFFQAPQGYSAALPGATVPKVTPNLASLLNASGYYIDYASDKNDRPNFLKDTASAVSKERWRFRLMELAERTESLQIYFNGPTLTKLNSWFIDPITKSAVRPLPSNTSLSTRLLGENVIALILLPHRSPNELPGSGTTSLSQLSPAYAYDSRRYLVTGPADTLAALWKNQLPPLIQVTMVAIDEKSAARLQDSLSDKTIMPESLIGLDQLFLKPSTNPGVHADDPKLNDQYVTDLAALEATLVNLKLTYRVFSTDVSILQAKWSEN